MEMCRKAPFWHDIPLVLTNVRCLCPIELCIAARPTLGADQAGPRCLGTPSGSSLCLLLARFVHAASGSKPLVEATVSTLP